MFVWVVHMEQLHALPSMQQVKETSHFQTLQCKVCTMILTPKCLLVCVADASTASHRREEQSFLLGPLLVQAE